MMAPTMAFAQDKTKDQLKTALSIKPIQTVDVDSPTGDEAANCKIERTIETIDIPGWLVVDQSGRKLRQFLDLDSDKKLDVWQFYKNGVEVYRELDSNKDDKRDQFRWLGTAGTRWGVDEDQNGTIDRWKQISAEEVAGEVFIAIRERDADRFRAVLLTNAELKKLGLRAGLSETIATKITESAAGFAKTVDDFKKVSSKSEFAHFGSSTPNLIAQDFEKSGNQFDVNFYDNSSAVFSDGASDGKSYGQIALGTLVKTNDGWRVVELPALMQEGKVVANGGIFLSSPLVSAAEIGGGTTGEGLAKMYDEFEKLDKSLRDVKAGAETEKLQAKRVDVLMQLILNSSGDENRSNWIRQMADTVMNAYETGLFDKGLEALEAAGSRLKKEGIENDNDYIAWRIISARYSKSAEGSTTERTAASERFQKDLEGFIAAYPKSELAPEGLNQIALYAEVNGNDEESLKKATEVYARIEKEYPQSKWAARAKGARARINSIGEKIAFTGKTFNNQPFDLKNDALRGKVVVLHYWATWCEVCVSDFAELQRLGAKFKDDLVIVGVNLDDSLEAAQDHLKKNSQFKWTQLYAPGGIADSPLAVQLGVSTLPLVVLIDQEGKVVDTGLSAKELDRNIQRVLK